MTQTSTFAEASLSPVSARYIFPLLLALLAAFFVLELTYPRFPGTDEIFFKSAGRNLSQGGTFAAPEEEGHLHLDPPIERVYFTHPPLYSWLFGQWTRATGFSWAACVGYDALISAALALAVFGVANAVANVLLGPGSLGTALALLPALLTLLFRQVARPDELAMMLAYANAWWLLRPRASLSPPAFGMSFVSGALVGLMLGTSTGVFFAFTPLLAALWLRRVKEIREIAPSVAAASLGVVSTAALCLIPPFLSNSHFYRQYFQHVEIIMLAPSTWDRVAGNLSLTWQVAPQYLLILFATVPVLCLGMVTFWRAGRIVETLALFVAPLIGLGLVIYIRPVHTYLWFLEPWFLLMAVAVTAYLWQRWHLRLMVVGWLAAWLTVASAWPVKDYIVRIGLPPDQRLAASERNLRELIPPGARVLTSNGWWALGSDRVVYDPKFSDLQDLDRIQYFVTDSNGTGIPGLWSRPSNLRYDKMVREDFELISDRLPTIPIRVFGLRVSNSAYGFGTVVLRRRATAQTR